MLPPYLIAFTQLLNENFGVWNSVECVQFSPCPFFFLLANVRIFALYHITITKSITSLNHKYCCRVGHEIMVCVVHVCFALSCCIQLIFAPSVYATSVAKYGKCNWGMMQDNMILFTRYTWLVRKCMFPEHVSPVVRCTDEKELWIKIVEVLLRYPQLKFGIPIVYLCLYSLSK